MSSSKARPNVVLILSDQFRAFELGCYGNSVVRTPNLDRLAEKGVRFEIACSNDPVCSPGRSILIGGQYARTCTGNLSNYPEPVPERYQLKDPTISEVFRDAGYHTGLIGKWHIGPEPETLGFDFAVYPKVSHRYTNQLYIKNGERFVVEDFAPNYEMRELGDYIREHACEPFFLFYNISQPHMPHADAPEHYKKMYSRDSVPLRDNVWQDGKLAYDEHWFKIYLHDYLYYQEHLPYTEHLPDGFDLRDLTALYYGLTTWTDDQVGELMRLLEENGIADNTLVVFTSDHGDNLGSHGWFNKDLLYEESIRIPLILKWPAGLAPRAVTQQVSSLVDVMPTVLTLAGLPIPGSVQGTDLSAVVRGDSRSVGPNAAFIENTRGEIGIRTLTHLYGAQKRKVNGRTAEVIEPEFMFFDVTADPMEMTNLAKTQEQHETANELRERLLAWDRKTPWMT